MKTNKKKILLLDLDDTLNKLVPRWLQFYNKDFNDNLQIENIKSWDICNYVKPTCGHKIYDYLLLPDLFRDLDIQPNAYEVTKWLLNYVDIYIVTSYIYQTCVDKVKWIKKHLPHIDTNNIVFCNNKGLIKADYIIDDGDHNILDFQKTNLLGLPIIFDMPWNRDFKDKYNKSLRVKNWIEIQELFEKILMKAGDTFEN